ncbi:hypothetical protein SOV_25920 [Sporomusa ovata DSM 2662]|uniref:Uncharacterized protein n=1 Tax=Sporomusa ovata TaxID=2378 RepID=A0A0U1L598_9FIRM|nr:hypothetical protein [Sporomusa ovata]EQB25905.1 hypothetical protein SOV_4c05720 [Sporomusa ovata DSM 2662]CQR74479.1 hypothetical protein SpAn4DRAFT_0941 [Sporomusa ovata]
MSILDWFKNLFAKEAKHYVFTPISSDIETIEFKEGQHYFRLRLAEMFLKNDRKLFRSYVPVVSSSVQLQFGSNAAQELPYIAGPLTLALDEASLGKGVQLNYSLTNLVPYHGGNVAISAALLAYVTKDYFQEFLSMSNSIATLLTIGQLSTTLKVVDSAVSGMQDLFDAGDKEIHLVFHNEYSGTDSLGGVSLQNGYFAVIAADAAKFETEKLFVKDSQLQFGEDSQSAKPLTGYDYMLFLIEAALYRDDFRYFDDYNSLMDTAIEKGMTNKTEGDAILKTVMLAVFKSDDLTYVDKTRVATALKKEYEERISFQSKLGSKVSKNTQWLNDRVVALDPEVVSRQISPVLADENLNAAAIADKILAMVMNAEIE